MQVGKQTCSRQIFGTNLLFPHEEAQPVGGFLATLRMLMSQAEVTLHKSFQQIGGAVLDFNVTKKYSHRTF